MAGSVRPSHSLDRTLPATRCSLTLKVVQQIMDESSAFSYFWLYGPTGAGITAILQAIEELLVIGG